MRRALASFVLCLFFVLPASPAAAQSRDPFVPLVTEDLGGGVVDPGTVPVAEVPEPAMPSSGALSTTGFPVTEFVMLALVLIGGGSLITWSARRPRFVRG